MHQKRSQSAEITLLHSFAAQIGRGESLQQVLGRAIRLLAALPGFDECGIYVRKGGQLRRQVTTDAERTSLTIEPELHAALARCRVPIVVESLAPACRYKILQECAATAEKAFVCVPLLLRSEILGAITIAYAEPRTCDASEARVLDIIAHLLSRALRISELENRRSELRFDLETQKLVARSRGILQRDLGLSADEAYLALQRQSREKKRPIKDIAQAIILSAQVKQESLHA